MNSKYNKTIEQDCRFSKSRLWELQRAAYRQYGTGAWLVKKVPYYLTNNPRIADQYAQLVIGFIRDCLSPSSSMTLKKEEPLYILDMGAGTGIFAYYFLKSLLPTIQTIFPETVKVCYVLADLSKETVDFWEKQPNLQLYIQLGILDFCLYCHPEKTKSLHLLKSGKILNKKFLANPLVLIGNYLFDSLPHDIFRVQEHNLEEGKVSLDLNSKHHDLSDPGVIPQISLTTNYSPLKNSKGYYPENPLWNRIIEDFASENENLSFLLPVGAFEMIDDFREMSRGRLLLLTTDQGMSTITSLQRNVPFYSKHESFSITVNYHAIADYIKLLGGTSFLTSQSEPMLVQMAAVTQGGPDHFPELKEAFKKTFDAFDIFEILRIAAGIVQEWKKPSLDFILKFMKWMQWDPFFFESFYVRIREQLPQATEAEKIELGQMVHHVWDNVYIINKKDQIAATGILALNMGVLFYEMVQHDEALRYFQKALDMGYTEPVVAKNIAAAYLAKGDKDNAKYWHAQSKSVD